MHCDCSAVLVPGDRAFGLAVSCLNWDFWDLGMHLFFPNPWSKNWDPPYFAARRSRSTMISAPRHIALKAAGESVPSRTAVIPSVSELMTP